MKIIIDWDNTLFDTTRMRMVSFNLLEKYGVARKDWKKAWPVAIGKNYLGRVLYSVREHARKYSKNNVFNLKGFLRDYVAIHEGQQYLYPDTIRFLQSVKRIGLVELVTYGHKRFQQWKVDMSGIRNHFHKVRVVPVIKARKFHEIISKSEQNVFIDDNSQEIDEVKKIFPEVVAIHMRRPRSWHIKTISKYRDYEVKNLDQALKVIEKLNSPVTTSIEDALAALRLGKVIVYPTDTAYALGADATNLDAVRRLYKAKSREAHKPVHIMVADLNMAKKYVKFDKISEKVFKKFLPGPLTIIAPLRPPFHLPLMRGRKRGGHSRQSTLQILAAGTGTMGIRISKNKIALELVKKLGKPITTTSANVAGKKTVYSVGAILEQYKNKLDRPALVLDAGTLPKRKTSTIVSVSGGKIKIFREGPVTKKQIKKVIQNEF